MVAFARPKLLLWHNDAWQVQAFSAYLNTPSRPTAVAFEHALAQLASLPKRQRRYPVCLPQEWLVHGEYRLPEAFPSALYPLAAHTYAAYHSALLDHERVTGFVCHERRLQFAILSYQHWEAITQRVGQAVYSDALIRTCAQQRWSKIRQQVAPMTPFEEDYIEKRQAKQQQRRLGYGMLGVAVMTLFFLAYCYYLLPDLSPLPEPMVAQAPAAPSQLASLRYVRSLPAVTRLDQVIVSANRVELTVSGDPQDLVLWQQQWPADLPPLKVVWQQGGDHAME